MTDPGAPASEFSEEFEQGMRARMAASYFKYGPVRQSAGRIDPIANVMERLHRYQDTGNTEWLMDVANFAMIEFMFPQHPKAHYRATDSDESPGRVAVTEWSHQRYATDKPNAEL